MRAWRKIYRRDHAQRHLAKKKKKLSPAKVEGHLLTTDATGGFALPLRSVFGPRKRPNTIQKGAVPHAPEQIQTSAVKIIF